MEKDSCLHAPYFTRTLRTQETRPGPSKITEQLLVRVVSFVGVDCPPSSSSARLREEGQVSPLFVKRSELVPVSARSRETPPILA